jgi:ATPase subunit of ABC transporter with duplicated ATPase domains
MGKNGAGKSTLLKMVAGQWRQMRDVKLGAACRWGYFAQQSLDCSIPI